MLNQSDLIQPDGKHEQNPKRVITILTVYANNAM